jgi:hypothetical protein
MLDAKDTGVCLADFCFFCSSSLLTGLADLTDESSAEDSPPKWAVAGE